MIALKIMVIIFFDQLCLPIDNYRRLYLRLEVRNNQVSLTMILHMYAVNS